MQMKNIAKTVCAAVLAAAMALPMLAGCAAGGNGNTTVSGGTDAANTAETTTEGAVTTVPIKTGPTPEDIAEGAKTNKYALAGKELCERIISDYYVSRTHMVRAEPKSSNAAFVWAFGAFLEALSDTLRIYPDDENIKAVYIDALTNGISAYRVRVSNLKTPAGSFRNITYYNAGRGGSGDYYYDDNAWICYQFLTAYELLGEKQYLDRAIELLEFFETGIDDVLGGGVYWDKSFGSKNTCSNGPISICFLWAYKLTGEQKYLDIGKSIFDWMNKKLLDGNLYSDSISLNGNINGWKSDYNQGTPLYAACLLYDITGENTYKSRAARLANAAKGLCFNVSGTGDNRKVGMNGNPIYKSWCVAWIMRGFMKYAEISGKPGVCFEYMEQVLDNNESTKDKRGYYDPYFKTGDWGGESKSDVLQPSGVASVYMICARFDICIADYLKG